MRFLLTLHRFPALVSCFLFGSLLLFGNPQGWKLHCLSHSVMDINKVCSPVPRNATKNMNIQATQQTIKLQIQTEAEDTHSHNLFTIRVCLVHVCVGVCEGLKYFMFILFSHTTINVWASVSVFVQGCFYYWQNNDLGENLLNEGSYIYSAWEYIFLGGGVCIAI